MKVWRAFRGTAMWAAIVTIVLVALQLALSSWPTGDSSSSGEEELSPLTPATGEIVIMALSVVALFLVVFFVMVVVSLLRGKSSHARRSAGSRR
ncbi:MAG: hypothetical protein ABW004_06020 [Aeromicrobium sp.]